MTCKWCQEGNPSVPSAVTDGFVHTNTPVGRVICTADVVPCKWCGKPSPMLGTKMCDGCWELDHRIRGDLQLAERIVAHYKSVQPAEIPLNAELAKVCQAALSALRSYQYGNSAIDLAEETADALQAEIAKVWP